MRACRPSWCASGHRQPVRRTMNGAPSAVWSSTWPHGVERRSKGSSISSISFAAASRRPGGPASGRRRGLTRTARRHRRSAHCRGVGRPAVCSCRVDLDVVGACCWYGCPGSVGACSLNEALVVGSRPRRWHPRPVGRPGQPDRASGPRRGGQPRAARACGIRSRCRSLLDLNRYSTG
jgi:hypothetical protein